MYGGGGGGIAAGGGGAMVVGGGALAATGAGQVGILFGAATALMVLGTLMVRSAWLRGTQN